MFENQNKEQVVEEVLDSVDTNEVEETSVDNTPSTRHDEQLINYLNPDLFKDVKVLNKSELEQENTDKNLSEGIINLYSSTFTDISENSLLI